MLGGGVAVIPAQCPTGDVCVAAVRSPPGRSGVRSMHGTRVDGEVGDVRHVGALGRPGFHARLLHLPRLAVGRAVHPGPAQRRHRPQSRVTPAGPPPHHQLFERQAGAGHRPGGQGPDGVLPARADHRREVPATGRPTRRRADRRLPLQRALLRARGVDRHDDGSRSA